MSMQLDFSGKRVLVTGSTKGIGRGAAEGFHELGAMVAINGRTPESVAQAIDEMGGGERLIAAPGDLSRVSVIHDVVPKAIEALGGLDILVNNAGRGDERLIDDVDEAHWEAVLALNIKGAFFTIQASLPALKKTKGCVVNVASMLGVMGAPAGIIVYSTTKGAMVNMTRMMALELARDGVRVNNLCPGWIDTPMIEHDNELMGGDALYKYIDEECPLGRIGQVSETTGAILYLSSASAGYTTGSTLVTDGGISSGH
jgi:NAD(P)-dependent dehydrogenase (short-subunit alcohol dehydrogenase family)